jgi:hypothetical protein
MRHQQPIKGNRLEKVSNVEYRLLCFLRKRQRRARKQPVCFKITVQNDKIEFSKLLTTGKR